MKEIVREPNQRAITFRNDRVHGFGLVEESRPRRARDLVGQCGRTGPAVERVVAVPQRQPSIEICVLDRTNDEIAGHDAQA